MTLNLHLLASSEGRGRERPLALRESYTSFKGEKSVARQGVFTLPREPHFCNPRKKGVLIHINQINAKPLKLTLNLSQQLMNSNH